MKIIADTHTHTVASGHAYGTIMAVPAHDGRDWDFAKKFGLKIIPVLAGGEPDKGG